MLDFGGPREVIEHELHIRRQRELPLPDGGDNDLENVDDRAAGALLVPVLSGAGEEDEDGDEHSDAADGVGPAPADVVLDVDEDGDGEEGADADEEEEAVEEEGHLGLLPRVLVVELVGAESGDAGLEPAGSEGDEIEAQVEEAHLEPVGSLAGKLAGGGGGAWRRSELRQLRSHCEHSCSLHALIT